MTGFESFNRNMLPRKDEPYLTLHSRGTISLNRSAFDALGGPGSVELLYDRERAVIGLRGVDHRAENAYHLRRGASEANGPWVVSAMAFTRFYDIDTSVTMRWKARMEDGVLCADISAPGTSVTRRR